MGTELLNSEFSLHSPPPAEDVCHRSPLRVSPPPSCTPPPPSRTLTAPPSSSELEPQPLVSLEPELVLDLCSDPSSSATPGTPPSSSSFSPTLSLDSLCPRPWFCSV